MLEPNGTAQVDKPAPKRAAAVKADAGQKADTGQKDTGWKPYIPSLALAEAPTASARAARPEAKVVSDSSTPTDQPTAAAEAPKAADSTAAPQAMAAIKIEPLPTAEPQPVPIKVAEATPASPEAAEPKPVPLKVAQAAPSQAAEPKQAPIRIAQAATPRLPPPPPPPPSTPPASGGAAGSGKLISLDFKDADIVNLLRILSAESGRNIVAGDDVKGKVSVSLHNVTWEQALDTILETRQLQRLDRNGIIRIVSTDQLTKEREAQARVQDALVKAEADARTRRAEAELKEAEARSRQFQSEAAIAEAKARGPLKEETVRLSYADPEEVAKTLQGILGIPPSGSQPVPSMPIINSVPQNPTV